MILEKKGDLTAFAAAVRGWIKDTVPMEWQARVEAADEDELVRLEIWWMGERAKVGLAIPHWPAEYGGADLSLRHQVLIAEEFARAGAPTSNAYVVSLNHIPGTLIPWGTEWQKQKYLPTVARGVIWCQGFSEPGAGSDLASLRTSAVRDGDHYIVNGQKVWSSYSMYADYCILLTRTSAEGKKQQGITYFILDMHSQGVEVRPIRQATGRSEFAELFLTDVRIPVADRVGEENQGWEVTQSTLAAERGVVTFERAERQRYALERFLRESIEADSSWLEDVQLRREFAELYGQMQAGRRLIRGFLSGSMQGREGKFSIAPSAIKIMNTEFRRRLGEFLVKVGGLTSQTISAGQLPADSDPMMQFLNSFAGTIAAGSNEIMRNIIAERGLGMPR